MKPYVRQKLSENVYFTSVTDPKFKRNRLSVRLFTPHGGAHVAANAAVPFLMRKGCASYPDFTLLNQRLCELYDAALSSDVGVAGRSQTVLLSLSTLDDRYALDGDRITEDCAALLCDLLLHPHMPDGVFPEKDFRIEQRQMLDDIDAEMNEKRRYAFMRYARTLYEGELSSLPRYGSRAAVEQLCAEDVSNAYRELMRTASVEIMFAGCGSPEAALEQFFRAFSVSEVRTPFESQSVFCGCGKPRELTERMPVAQAKLIAGWTTGIGLDDPLSYAASVMNVLLSGSLNSLLFREVRERLQLCYYCSSSFDRSRGVLTVDAGIEEKQREQVLEAVGEQLQRLAKNDYPDELLDEARLFLTDLYQGVEDSLSGVENFTLSQLLYEKNGTVEEELSRLLSVTREEIAAVATRLQPELVYCLAGNGEEEAE